MTDLISRELAIELLGNTIAMTKKEERRRNYCVELIKAMPSAEPQWIPVSEGKLKGGSNVLVCFDFKGERTVEMATYYSNGKFIGFNDEYLTKEGRKYRKAIAWMEKPKPYEGDKQ